MIKNIMLSGPDGVGKSTISLALKEYYKSDNVPVEIVWIRFHHYFQKIVNFLGRITGKSYDEKYSWGRDNYHDYHGFFGVVYIFAAFIDHVIFRIFIKRKLIKNQAVYILDRYIIDIAADLIVDTKKPKLVLFLFDRFILYELKNFNVFILECDINIVESRRSDIKDDKKYIDKIKAYELLSGKFSILRINTGDNSININVQKIVNK